MGGLEPRGVKNRMHKIITDRTGTLQTGVFYTFKPWVDRLLVAPTKELLDKALRLGFDLHPLVAPGSIICSHEVITRCGEEASPWIYLLQDIHWNCENQVFCPINPKHSCIRYKPPLDSEAFGGPLAPPFIPDLDTVAVNENLKVRIERAKVKGALFYPITVRSHNTGKKIQGIWYLEFTGSIDIRSPRLVGLENRCPFCGKGAVLCDGCGCILSRCSSCNREMTIGEPYHNGPSDLRIPVEHGPLILEGRLWDGSDLVSVGDGKFASRRFLNWLIGMEAGPFTAEPALLCTDGMTDEQLKWLAELNEPLTG